MLIASDDDGEGGSLLGLEGRREDTVVVIEPFQALSLKKKRHLEGLYVNCACMDSIGGSLTLTFRLFLFLPKIDPPNSIFYMSNYQFR